MKNVSIISAVLFLMAGSAVADDLFTSKFSGVWHGVGLQIDAQDWGVQIEVNDEQTLIQYLPDTCSGNWAYLKVDEEQLVAVEHITEGDEICLDGGLVRLQPYDEGMLLYKWYDVAGEVLAAAILIEGELNKENYDALLDLTRNALDSDFVVGPYGAKMSIGNNET